MWTHADKMWTDADNKCWQHRDPLHAKGNGMVLYCTVHLRTLPGSAIFWGDSVGTAFRVNDSARINFSDTADNFGQKMRTDADCPQ
jgi:hypothetical protein